MIMSKISDLNGSSAYKENLIIKFKEGDKISFSLNTSILVVSGSESKHLLIKLYLI